MRPSSTNGLNTCSKPSSQVPVCVSVYKMDNWNMKNLVHDLSLRISHEISVILGFLGEGKITDKLI